MSGQSGGNRVYLGKLNEQLTCKLCGGYFIDATTIIECLHSFCRSCIVKYLRNNKYCPICEVQVHKSRPLLNIRPDHTLQDIVYKLVPGCYQNEMRCRREFYAKHPEACNQVTSPEARGEPIESHIYSPDESLSLSLEYFNPNTKDVNETNIIKENKPLLRRYLRCPAAVTVFHLQKLIRAKYGLSDAHRVDIMYKEEPLCSNYTLMDVMYIYHWRRKVPLHLSYRIFESSLKRMKLSEDNADYNKLLTNAGIDSVELKDEESLKREWKEVQLKISETGVMSITDISNTVHKRDAEIENIQDEKISKETITSYMEVNKTDSLVENCGISKSAETMQPILVIDAQVTENPMFPDINDASSFITHDIKATNENSSNCTSLIAQQNGDTMIKQTNETGKCVAPISQQDTREIKCQSQTTTTTTIEDKSFLQGQKIVDQSVIQLDEQNVPVVENTDGLNTCVKKLSLNNNNNNNNNNTDFRTETQKQCAKSTGETKIGNAGSKIDALSVKLQFQPKMGQVNNTYSKKAPKEKRAILQATRKLDGKSTLTEDTKLADTSKMRINCGSAMDKVSVSCSTTISPQKAVVSNVMAPQDILVTDSSSKSSGQQAIHETDNQNTSIDVQQALNLLEQKTSTPAQTALDSGVPQTSTASTANQRLQSMQQNSNKTTPSENVASIVPNISTSTISQTTSTFPYTVHDLVTNSAALKATLKNVGGSDGGSPIEKSLKTSSPIISTSSIQMPSISQISMQTSPMYSTSVKNNYGNASQGITAVTTATSKPMTSTSTSTGTCPVPPCPDAIPISLMKQTSMRKQEATAKGTNLNEICAKIGSTGSKINDICAKIGENSKEKNRIEARKSDVPDLLKINTKKSPSQSFSNSDTMMKHIPNIPNVPVYTPSSNVGNATTMEIKTVKLALPTSTTAGSLAVSTSSATHVTQRMSTLKKQSQSMGYKTLRDPPKSWNPTLSKNNYVAVKNQAKEMQNQTQTSNSEGTSKQIPSKPAKIFKMRNMPRYLGNPASGVKPMYGVANDTKEKEQSTTSIKNTTLNMMKIDPKTLSPIVSTVNSPIVSPPPYSPNARSYQNTPYSRDICRNTGSPISPRNSPVNMLSTNPFIPSPTPNTNPRIIYSHFLPPFPDANQFPNPLIRSPIGIPPPSAFHSSLPPSINKLYQRSSYIPQTTGYSPVSSQPPAIQRIPPSTHSSSPKSPKTSSPSSNSSTSINLGKTESQSSPITSTVDSVSLLLSKNVPVTAVPVTMPIPVSLPVPSQRELNAFNLSKSNLSGNSISTVTSSVSNSTSPIVTTAIEALSNSKQSSSMSFSPTTATTNVKVSENSGDSSNERKHCKDTEAQKVQETVRCQEENISTAKLSETRCNTETVDIASSTSDKKEKTKINGDVTMEQFINKKSKEDNNETVASTETAEQDDQAERSSSKECNDISKSNQVQTDVNDLPINESMKNENLDKTIGEQIQGKKSETQKNKVET